MATNAPTSKHRTTAPDDISGRAADHAGTVNNEIYHALGERWYTAQDDPVALLRAEARTRDPWVAAAILRAFPVTATSAPRVLDIACGGGFLTNLLARKAMQVTGIDASVESLAIARQYDATGTVRYEEGDAYALPYGAGSFEAVCAMDFLEHVREPARVVGEAARVLRPGGLFFFSTFNRNWLAWLIVIKGVEWFVKNTPPDMHQLDYFVKPSELRAASEAHGLRVTVLQGLRPRVDWPFLRMLLTREVRDDVSFQIGGKALTGYIGYAVKQ